DKEGIPIHLGDYVKARFREGNVCSISDKERITKSDLICPTVKHPPKVIFTDQRGNQVSHNPSAIVHGD
ncbi:hypothetical protein M422DRAFT_142039, partial [Sphaerobolus stellatus SS14]